MIDFKITESGDLILKDKENLSKKITFAIGNQIKRINFNFNSLNNINNYKSIKFDFNNDSIKKIAAIASGDDFLMQQIENSLKTALTEIKSNVSFGLSFERFKTKDITDENLFNELSNDIKKIVQSIDSALEIDITREYDKTSFLIIRVKKNYDVIGEIIL